MHIDALPAFDDNYIWLVEDGRHALVVDPGDAAPVLAACRQRNLELIGILVTHHHGDHCGGLPALLHAARPLVWGPSDVAGVNRPLHGGESLHVPGLDLDLKVLAVPGHTLDHLAFHAPAPGWLFCGDTLFNAGCGRLFEGTPAQLADSLERLAALPANTQMYCAHEYTLGNLQFALAVEPGKPELIAYHRWCVQARAAGRPTVPSPLSQQREVNPFLRLDTPGVQAALSQRLGHRPGDRVEALAALRAWKDQFV